MLMKTLMVYSCITVEPVKKLILIKNVLPLRGAIIGNHSLGQDSRALCMATFKLHGVAYPETRYSDTEAVIWERLQHWMFSP